jgi:putative membrane protein
MARPDASPADDVSEDAPTTRAGALSPWWIAFAVVILGIPITAVLIDTGLTFTEILPTLNASLNAMSATLLFAGWRAIRAGRRSLHWKLMLSAVATSALFLTFYLIRFALTGAHRYPDVGWTRTLYLVVLGTHTVLAAAVPFLVARSLWLAYRQRYDKHRAIARWTFPIWMYVSVTGVAVYAMLYHLAPWLAAR